MTATTAPASDPAENESAWGETAPYEPRWPASVAVVVALALYVTLPEKLVVGGPWRWILPIAEAALIVPLTLMAPHRHEEESQRQRFLAIVLIALVNLGNLVSLALLVHFLLAGKGTNSAAFSHHLIFSSIQIWLTNVIVFALWYWELDRGGPGKRCRPAEERREPDFLFPQMANPQAAPPHWVPSFVDYLYVSFTNASAFSPTDTMPLTEWAKMLMLIQSLASLLTVVLVTARAVNILT